MKKQRKKPKAQLMKNLLNLMKKQEKKLIICYFVGGKKPLKPSLKNGEKNQILVKNKDEILRSYKLKI